MKNYSQHEAAQHLGMDLVSFKRHARSVLGHSLESDLVSEDELTRFEQALKPQVQQKNPPQKAPETAISKNELPPEPAHFGLQDADLKMQAYMRGIQQANLAYAIQTQAFQLHLNKLIEGDISPDINANQVASEIARIEAELAKKQHKSRP